MNHKFVEIIPEDIEENTIYISILYATAIHKCCCGCNEEVVTPITPNDWTLSYNGEGISLSPSIGNWSFNCRSHYWIKNNQIIWASDWSKEQVILGRKNDLLRKEIYYKDKQSINNMNKEKRKPTLLSHISKLFNKLFK